MDLPPPNSSREDIRPKVREKVAKTRSGDSRTDAVYVLKCEKPPSKQTAIDSFRNQFQEFKDPDDLEYHTRRVKRQVPSKPDSFEDAISEDPGDEYISYPSWIEFAYEVEDVYYVGWSNGVTDRIVKHIIGDGALFTRIFTPLSIEEIRWYSTEDAAKTAEHQVAQEYSDIGDRSPTEFEDEEVDVEKFLATLRDSDSNNAGSKYAYSF